MKPLRTPVDPAQGLSPSPEQVRDESVNELAPLARSQRKTNEPGVGPAEDQLVGDSRGFILRRVLAVGDLAAVTTACLLVAGLRHVAGRAPLGIDEILLLVAFLPLWVGVGALVGLYHLPGRRVDHSIADELGPAALTATVWGWLFLLARAVVNPGPVEVLTSLALWVFAIVAVLLFRVIANFISRRQSWYRQRVAIAGSRLDVTRVNRRLRRHYEFGLDVVLEIEELDLEDPERLVGVLHRAGVSRIVLATPPADLEARSGLIRHLLAAHVHVDVISGETDAFSAATTLHYIEGLPVLTFPAVRSPRAAVAAKRLVDVAAAGLALVVLAPLLAYCAARIRLGSPGPVLFRQLRIGRDGEPFQLIKFRTMTVDAESRKREVAELNFHAERGDAGMFKIAADPRVTTFGARLRRWSIDELPQLWNVVKGEMSLVGPRPLIPEEARLISGHYGARESIRPGITGPWQTLGRSDIGFDDMIKLDYTYASTWSFSQDVKLLVRTVEAVIQGRGAY